MSKGLGQKIVIKFTEDLVGNVSGKDTLLGLGWTRSEFEKSTNTTPRTNGWRFSPIQDIEVTALMIFSDVSTNVTMHLWRVSDQAKLTQITFMSKAGEWASGELPVPITLIANTEYVVTSNTPINDGYMYSDTLTIDKRGDFSPHITMIDAYRVDSQNTFPTNRLTGPYTNSVGFAYKMEHGVGNEIAFTVTGQEYQYVNGPMIDKEYRVEKVERYPIQRVWELGESLSLDLPGEMTITDAQCYIDSGITSLTGTVYANDGDIVLATATHRGVFTPPDGWEFLYESPTIGTVNHRMIVFKKHVDEGGLVSFTASQDISQLMYLNLISISGISDIIFAPELESIYRGGVKPAPMPDKQEGEKIIWAATVSLYATSSPYGGWSTTPDDLTIIHLDQSSYAPRLANLIDFGNGQPNNRTIMQSPNTTGTDVNIAGFKVIQNYSTPKIYTSQVIQLDGEYRLRWIENKPEGTDILIEYTTGETQGEWLEVSNGEVITSDTNMWFRITLETTDTSVTPTLQDLWLEEPEAPNDQIRLVMHPQGRFNNVEGSLTVQYDHTKGSLRGRRGPVDSFTETFMPTDLEPKPNPHVAENIEVSAEANVSFTKVTYNQRYADEQITASATVTVDFIYVGIINP